MHCGLLAEQIGSVYAASPTPAAHGPPAGRLDLQCREQGSPPRRGESQRRRMWSRGLLRMPGGWCSIDLNVSRAVAKDSRRLSGNGGGTAAGSCVACVSRCKVEAAEAGAALGKAGAALGKGGGDGACCLGRGSPVRGREQSGAVGIEGGAALGSSGHPRPWTPDRALSTAGTQAAERP